MNVSHLLHRRLKRFADNPVSVRNAARVIIVSTILMVFFGGIVVWLFDHSEYPNLGRAWWFTLQTVTTVGYGDVTPTHTVGRVVAAAVMLSGIAFLTMVTAAVTSTFINSAGRQLEADREAATGAESERTKEALASIADRLDSIERSLGRLTDESGPSRSS